MRPLEWPGDAGRILAMVLRDADDAEFRASDPTMDPIDKIIRYIETVPMDVCKVVVEDDKIIAIFGLCKGCSGAAGIWMVATDEIVKYQLSLIKYAKSLIAEWLEKYPVLLNRVDVRNTVHIKWLKWMGAEFWPECIYNELGYKFRAFKIRKDGK